MKTLIVLSHSLALSLALTLIGCSEAPPPVASTEEREEYRQVFAEAEVTADVQEKWARSCALCHVSGEGGAPRMGDQQAWQARLDQGNDTLMAHTINGFNRMPPLGYCMDCETSDFAAMIKLMAGEI